MKRHSTLRNLGIVLVIICLAAVLGGLLVYNRQLQAERRKSLTIEAEQTKTNDPGVAAEPQTEEHNESAQAEPENQKAENKPEESAVSAPTPTPVLTAAPTPTAAPAPIAEQEENKITGISIRGDDFSEDIIDPPGGYPARLKILLEDAQIDIPVEDDTWEMAGTLSQMALAGVSDDTISDYIAAHEDAAEGEVSPTELRVRSDLLEKVSARHDQFYLPVILTGYYGGWGNDPEELAEQIRKILDTYEETDAYIVAGVYPYSYYDTDTYDKVMRETFGDHYLQINEATGLRSSALMSPDGRQAIAQAIYDKMTESGYLN